MQDNNAGPPTNNASHRRTPGPNASQPRIGTMMLRIACTANVAHDVIDSFSTPGHAPALEEMVGLISSTLTSSDRFDERQVTVSTLCDLVRAEALNTQRSLERGLGDLTKVPRRRANTGLLPWTRRALLAAGLDVEVEDFDSLHLLSHPASRLAAQMLAAAEALTSSTNGTLAAELSEVFNVVREDVSITEATMELSRVGIDAERLCWAAVSREATRHIPLVLKEANMAARAWPDRSADSLIGYAWQGLRLALRNYDPDRGMFSTYACPRIRGTIRDGIRSEHHLPKRLTTFVRKVDATREKLRADLGKHPSLEEVANAMGVELARLTPITRMGAPLSYDDLMSRPAAATPSALIDQNDPVEATINHARIEAVRSALDTLPSAQALAVQLLVLDGYSVTEAEARSGVPARALRLNKDRALESLSVTLAEWAPVG